MDISANCPSDLYGHQQRPTMPPDLVKRQIRSQCGSATQIKGAPQRDQVVIALFWCNEVAHQKIQKSQQMLDLDERLKSS